MTPLLRDLRALVARWRDGSDADRHNADALEAELDRPRPPGRRAGPNRSQVVALSAEGMTPERIAACTGYTVRTVREYLRQERAR